jgi:hypothetical protein
MSLLTIDKSKLVEERVKTTPENVAEANQALFRATMNLPTAAKHCGMTQKEMKLTFREYLKYHPIDYENFSSENLS